MSYMDGVSPAALLSEASTVVVDGIFTCFYNDAAPTEIYTLSLHDALPISASRIAGPHGISRKRRWPMPSFARRSRADRKSTRLNSSHVEISYAVFCLKKKKTTRT